ncbi:MAG: type II secretion system protein [Opitutaceae bacterium]
MKTTRQVAGFTLIELLAVVGLMTVLAGGLGLALRDGSPTSALESAQAAMASLVAAARNQAVLSGSRAMVIIEAGADDRNFLRRMQIAIETMPATDQWRIVDEGIVLPVGIYVVPGSDPVDGAAFDSGAGGVPPWPTGRKSSLVLARPGSIGAVPSEGSGTYLRMSTALVADGTSSLEGGAKFVLAAARRTSTGVIFDHPEWVRGVALSAYGVATLINDGPGLDY